MKNNHQPNHQQWDPASRALWLSRHGAPANMRLVTDLELHVIAQGLEAERKKAIEHEKRAEFFAATLVRAAKDADSFLTLLQSLANQMDEPTGLAIIYEEAGRVRSVIEYLRDATHEGSK